MPVIKLRLLNQMATNYIENAGLEVKSPVKTNARHPLDVRMLVENVADLYNIHTWAVGDHSELSKCKLYLYDGMIVATSELDEKQRPQIYVLHGVNNLFNADHTLKNVPADPESWLTEENWQRLGYVTDVEESQFVFLQTKYGWRRNGDSYDNLGYYEETDENFNNIYTIDSEGREPGQQDYVRTPAQSVYSLKMKDNDTTDVLYVDLHKFTNKQQFSIKNGYTITPTFDFQSARNIVFSGSGAIQVSNEQFNYPNDTKTNKQHSINIGLKWQNIGPKPSNIQVIIDLGVRGVPCKNDVGNQSIDFLFDYVKRSENRLGQNNIQLLKFDYDYRMSYSDWESGNKYTALPLFGQYYDISKYFVSWPSLWSGEVLEVPTGVQTSFFKKWSDISSWMLECKPGMNYTIVLEPISA